MARRKVWIIAGVLVVAGGAAAIAHVGHREGRFRQGMMDHMGEGEGWAGRGGGMRGERGRQWGNRGDEGGPGGGRWGALAGLGQRAITQDDFDTRQRERFARLDKNSDGVIDAGEIEAGMVRRSGGRGERMGDMMFGRLLARFDTNRDGKIAKDEFLDRVKKDFARADLTNDGRITDDDLPPMMRGRDVLKGEGRGGMMGRGGMGGGGMGEGGMMGGLGGMRGADANKDGIITQDEVLAAATKRFEHFDRNKDGVVDKTDFDAMRKDMQAYGVQRFLHNFGADKEGKVTRDQFFKAGKERFAERDVNRDGRIDRNDMFPGGARPGGMDRGPGRGERGGPDREGRGMRGDGGPDGGPMPERGPPR